MSFAESEIQAMVAESLGRVLAERNGFEERRRRLAEATPDRLALWPVLAELGILGTLLPEDKGGSGGTMRDIAVVQSLLGQTLAVEPYLAAAMCARILLVSDGEAAAPALEALVAGERVLTLAVGSGFDPFAPSELTAARSGDGWRISGEIPVLRHGDLAHGIVTAASPAGGGGSACFLVPTDAAAVSVEPFRLVDSGSGARVVLSEAPAALLIAGPAADAAIAEAIDTGIVGLAAEAVGIMRSLNAATFEYLRTRKQFGVPLATFQALQHRAADMHIAAEEAEIMTERTVAAVDDPGQLDRAALVAAVKVGTDSTGRRVGHEAIQLHGGMGVSDELNVGHYVRRLAAIRAELGHADHHRARFLALSSRPSNAA